MNAVLELKQRLKAQSQRPYLARGHKVVRCEGCALVPEFCLCPHRRALKSRLEFALLMHRNEPFKPSNTGKLICDLLPETRAFAWHRTEPDPALLDWLDETTRIVFPSHYVQPARLAPLPETGQVKLLILDATWPQAAKMLRASRYLDPYPVTAIDGELLSGFLLRNQHQDGHLCTAEVAALLLEQAGEGFNGQYLTAWLGAFSAHYLAAKRHGLPGPEALSALTALGAQA
ncbi:MAG: DTW domain-containing protein [Pseudomonadota bacterium]|uniref:tRNA-uridine aminocarboxypropyltransferase n=1 Tax=Gallaecimonas pentaromativorans TaxID=584787 RepID=UPI00067EE370|nr:DTW domain-containing protein [Gallaecimonas pentaromativorans]MED5524490.1 DTW domain-containing protein [Pseudomonadota bacterium]